MSPKKEKVHIAPHQLWQNREEFPVQAHQFPHHPFIYGSSFTTLVNTRLTRNNISFNFAFSHKRKKKMIRTQNFNGLFYYFLFKIIRIWLIRINSIKYLQNLIRIQKLKARTIRVSWCDEQYLNFRLLMRLQMYLFTVPNNWMKYCSSRSF